MVHTIKQDYFNDVVTIMKISETEIHEDLQYFIAFCLQEGELQPQPRFKTEENRERYALNTPYLCIGYLDDDGEDTIDGSFSLAEWRQYIKDKYRIMPPDLGGNEFVSLTEKFFRVTGGIAFEGCFLEE